TRRRVREYRKYRQGCERRSLGRSLIRRYPHVFRAGETVDSIRTLRTAVPVRVRRCFTSDELLGEWASWKEPSTNQSRKRKRLPRRSARAPKAEQRDSRCPEARRSIACCRSSRAGAMATLPRRSPTLQSPTNGRTISPR